MSSYILRHQNCLLIIIAMLTASAGFTAESDENNVVTERYKQFNEALLRLNLSQARILIDMEKFHAFSTFAKKVKVDDLWKFYSKKNKASSIDCNAQSLCRESNILFLSTLAIKEFDQIEQKQINSEKIKMGVHGVDVFGGKTQILLNWVLEDNAWTIDEIMKIPVDWDPFARPIDNILNEKNRK